MIMSYSQQQQQQPPHMPSSSKQIIPKSSPVMPSSSSTAMPSVSHQPHSIPPSASEGGNNNGSNSNGGGDLNQYKTDTKLYELLQKTRTIPDFNQQLGDEILENLYEFSLDCSFFAKQRPDGRFILPAEHDYLQNPQRPPHPGPLKMPSNVPYSQPGPSSASYTPQSNQQQWQYSGSSSMHRPQMAGPSGQQHPITPLPLHPPEFQRFNMQVRMPQGLPPQQPGSLRSPFYPSSAQEQLYMQQQHQQKHQQQAGGPGSVRMMSPAYSQAPTPSQIQQQHSQQQQFSRQSSFKMNTPQPMIKQETPTSAIPNKHQGYIHQQQQQQEGGSYFPGRPPQQIQRIDSNDNEMKPPIMPNQAGHPQYQQQHRMNGVMAPPHYQPQTPNEMMSPKFQLKNELMSPQGRPLSTTSLISNGIQQSPLQANGQPISSMGQVTNVSPLVAVSPPLNGDSSPGCSSLAAVLATRPMNGKAVFAHAMDDPHRSTASPASEASTASTSSRKRVAGNPENGDDDDTIQKPALKRTRNNPKNMTYLNLLNFIKNIIPPARENKLILYICDLLLEHVKSSKRVLEWKDGQRTFTISKPRVFADRFREIMNVPDNSKEFSTTKMEAEMDKKLSKYIIGGYPLIYRLDQKTKTYVFLHGFLESEGLRENKTSIVFDHASKQICEVGIPMNPATKFSQMPIYGGSGAPIPA